MKIQAIPTTYAGVNFRSRLEARWAAMFDLLGLEWDYEPPIDLAGWIPDFSIATPVLPVYVEVKPRRAAIPMPDPEWPNHPPNNFRDEFDHPDYEKARAHWERVQVMLLGDGLPGYCGIGFLMDCPEGHSAWDQVFDAVGSFGPHKDNWRKAGNMVQWMPRK